MLSLGQASVYALKHRERRVRSKALSAPVNPTSAAAFSIGC